MSVISRGGLELADVNVYGSVGNAEFWNVGDGRKEKEVLY